MENLSILAHTILKIKIMKMCFCLCDDDEKTLGIFEQNLLLHMSPLSSLLLLHKHLDHMQVPHSPYGFAFKDLIPL